jgi:hypothetical protein
METPKLDQLIKMYKDYDSKNYLTDEEKEQMNEFLAIKQSLSQDAVSGRIEQLKCDCGETENVKKISICACCYNQNLCEW